MKTYFTALTMCVCLLFGTTRLSAQQKTEKLQQQAKQIRVYIETIEISSLEFAELMTDPKHINDDTKLRNALIVKCKNDTAKLISNQTLTVRNHERAVVESIREFIYPTEYDAPQFGDPKNQKKNKEGETDITPPTPTAFETRNLGTSIEIQPNADDNKTINLIFKPETTAFKGYINYGEWKIGLIKAKIIMPEFYTKRADLSVILTNGKFLMVHSHEPSKDGKADNSRKILTFVRAEILTSAPQ